LRSNDKDGENFFHVEINILVDKTKNNLKFIKSKDFQHNMSSVSQTVIRQFNNSQFFRMHIAALGGFVLGAKVFDLLFFKDENYEVIREEMEDEYWAKNGKNKIY